MPRSTREWALRKLMASTENLNWCQKHLLEVSDTYAEQHPDISVNILICVKMVEIMRVAILDIRGNI